MLQHRYDIPLFREDETSTAICDPLIFHSQRYGSTKFVQRNSTIMAHHPCQDEINSQPSKCSSNDFSARLQCSDFQTKEQSRNATTAPSSQVTKSTPTNTSTTTNNSRNWNDYKGTLGANFVPGPNDVICARGKQAWNHIGNQRFRKFVDQFCARYKNVESRSERSMIVTEIVQAITAKGSGFVRLDEASGVWVEVGNMIAREKVGQYFRSCLGYRSSFKSKRDRLKVTSTQNAEKFHEIISQNNEVQQAIQDMSVEYQDTTASPEVSDEAVLALFNQSNLKMLELIKSDDALVKKFAAATSQPSSGSNYQRRRSSQQSATNYDSDDSHAGSLGEPRRLC